LNAAWATIRRHAGRSALVRLRDPIEELRVDDASRPARYGPWRLGRCSGAELLARCSDLVEALGVGDHLGGVQRPADVLDEAVAVGDLPGAGMTGEDVPGRLALWERAGQGAGERRLREAGDRNPEVQGVLRRPAPGALLAGMVCDDVDERPAGVGVHVARTWAVISIRNDSR
jgi:hypothetical protein